MKRSILSSGIAFLLILGLITGCGLTETSSDAVHPVIKAFLIDGSADTLIVTEASDLRIDIKISAEHALTQVDLYMDGALLESFSAAPYRYELPVGVADNGFHAFRVSVVDELGNLAEASYPNRLAINIE